MEDARTWYRRRYLAVLALSLTAIFVVGSYLQRTSIETMISFQGNDVAGPLPETFTFPKAFGVHYFSDFLWSYAYVKEGIPSGYGGTSLFMFLVLRYLPYWIAFSIFLVISLSLLLNYFHRQLQDIQWRERTELVVSCVILTFPILASIDRGQVQLLQTGLCLSSVGFLQSNHAKTRKLGVLLLALAISIKGTPIFIAIWLIGRRRMREALASIAIAVPVGLLPLTFFNGGVSGSLEFIRSNLEFLRTQGYVESNLAFNNGFKGLLQSTKVLDIPVLAGPAQFLLSHYQLVIVLLALTIGAALLVIKLEEIESFILIAAGTTLVIDLSGGYTLALYLLPISLFLTNSVSVDERRIRMYGWLLCLLMIPKGIPVLFATSVFQRATPTFNSVINPLIGLMAVIGILAIGIRRMFSPSVVSREKDA